jgi:hypothetical protein
MDRPNPASKRELESAFSIERVGELAKTLAVRQSKFFQEES